MARPRRIDQGALAAMRSGRLEDRGKLEGIREWAGFRSLDVEHVNIWLDEYLERPLFFRRKIVIRHQYPPAQSLQKSFIAPCPIVNGTVYCRPRLGAFEPHAQLANLPEKVAPAHGVCREVICLLLQTDHGLFERNTV